MSPFGQTRFGVRTGPGSALPDQGYYLLTIIDYFPRFIVVWGIVKSVTQREVQNLLPLVFMSEDIDQKVTKPMIRFDQVSPNMAHSTKRLIKDLEILFHPAEPIGQRITPGIVRSSRKRFTVTRPTQRSRLPGLHWRNTFTSTTSGGPIRRCETLPRAMFTDLETKACFKPSKKTGTNCQRATDRNQPIPIIWRL